MPDLAYPANFQAVAAANQSGWYDAAGVEWHTAYGYYQPPGGVKSDEGAHVFRREAGALASTEVTLPEPRIPNRATLWPSAAGLELRGIRSATVRTVVPVPGVTAPVVRAADPTARQQAAAAQATANAANAAAAALGVRVKALEDRPAGGDVAITEAEQEALDRMVVFFGL